MSYCRFGWDQSDVYVFPHVDGGIECCGCSLIGYPQSIRFRDVAELFRHLDEHTAVGWTVPGNVIPDIRDEHAAGAFTAWDATPHGATDPWADRQRPDDVSTREYLERNRHMLGAAAQGYIDALTGEER